MLKFLQILCPWPSSFQLALDFYSPRSTCKYWSVFDSWAHQAVPWEPVGPWLSLPRPGPWLASRVEDAVMAWSGIWPSSTPSSFSLAVGVESLYQ